MNSEKATEAPGVDLDLSGLKCPLPVLKARKALRGYDDGAEVRVRVTDPKAPADFRALCDTVGHELLSQVAEPGGHRLTLRVHKP
ncbi:MAG: sulfurtransferase TusA family protein [Alphaproteobacteria bacterium]|nr:sulfurtransferase TusA family protein [Alphaproteobacteria bacterium]